MAGQWWLVIAQRLVGTITAPSAVSGLAGALSLLTHHWDQELPLPRGDLQPTMKSGCPHCPVTAVALPSTTNGQEMWGSPSCCTPRLQCSPHQLPVGTRGSISLEKPKSLMWGRTLDLRGEGTGSPARCQKLLSSLCRAQGPEPGDSQPRGESPSLRPAPMERDHGAFSLMQCYEYSGSFCSLFNGFECEKVVELGRGEERGEARPLCSEMLLQPWIYLAFGGLWGLSLLPSPAKACSLFCLMLISIAAAQERG